MEALNSFWQKSRISYKKKLAKPRFKIYRTLSYNSWLSAPLSILSLENRWLGLFHTGLLSEERDIFLLTV